jgi:hypothetical protein
MNQDSIRAKNTVSKTIHPPLGPYQIYTLLDSSIAIVYVDCCK